MRISFSNSSIRMRIFAIILLAALPMFALFVFDSSRQYEQLYQKESKNLLDVAKLVASNESKVIEGVHDLMITISEEPFIQARDWDACNAFLTRINARTERFSSFSIVNTQGDVVCAGSPIASLPNVSDRPYFQTVLQEKRFVGAGYVINRLTGQPIAAFALPLLSEQNEITGVALASLNLEAFTSVLREVEIPDGATISIVDHEGTVLASEPDRKQLLGKPIPSDTVRAYLLPAGGRVIAANEEGRVPRLFAIAPAPHEGHPIFYVVTGLDEAVLSLPAKRSLLTHLATLLTVVTLSLLGTWLASRRLLITPVANIIRALRQIATGNLKARTGMSYQSGELAELACHFDEMAATLEKREEENRAATQFIEYLAHHDELTKLPNRRELYQRLGQCIIEAKKTGKQVAVLFLDIDNFGAINDSLGLAAGDQLLTFIAESLQKCLEADDFAARLGSDEFVCVITNISKTNSVEHMVESISQALSQPYAIQDEHLRIRASIGISLCPSDSESSITAVQYAQMAMRAAKESGGKARFFTKEMNVVAFIHLKLENELRRALERDEFVLYYQPQVNLQDHLIVGAEALIRWEHPEKGIVSPGTFIALAEKTRLVIKLGEWALRTACFQKMAWREAGLPHIPVAVNVSAFQFRQLGFLESLRQALWDSQLPSQELELEITEGVLLGGDAGEILTAVHEMGISLSIDDFGTGYSSLSYLKDFPFDKLKIDQSFIKDIARLPDNQAITRAIVTIAKSLDLRVIAEGVEDAETCEFLRGLKCDAVQGYYYSKPVPAEDFSVLLTQNRTYVLQR